VDFVRLSEDQVPIYDESDVLVVGGGPAGLSAAVAAARMGCKTTLVEQGGCLGGTVTLGLNTNFMGVYPAINRGIFGEFCDRLKDHDAIIEGFMSPIDPEIFKALAFDFVQEERVGLLLHSSVVYAIRDQGSLKGVVVANKAGLQALTGRVVVDTSGDADVAARVGEAFDKVKKDEHAMTLLFRVGGADVYKFASFVEQHKSEFRSINTPQDDSYVEVDREKPLVTVGGLHGFIKRARERGELHLTHDNMWIAFLPEPGVALINATHVLGCDPTSPKDLTLAEIECRRQMMSVYLFLKKEIPGFEGAYLLDSAAHIGIRESRRLIGEYVLTFEDVQEQKKFEDVVAVNLMPVDIHGPGEQQTWIKLRGPYQVPYRSLRGKVNDNLLVAGRCISVDHMVQGSIRNVPCCFATGQAAGVAAALAVSEAGNTKKIDIKQLQGELTRQGVVLDG